MRRIQYLLYFGDLKFFFEQESFSYEIFIMIESGEIISIFFIINKDGFAGQFKMSGKSSAHHITFRAHIVRSYPFPQCQLLIVHDWLYIQYVKNILGFKKFRFIMMQAFYDTGIFFI